MENKFYVSIDGHQVDYKQLIEELVENYFRTTDKKIPLYQDIFYFVSPYTNQALALLSGIEAAYFSENFLCAAVLTRSLLDCMLSLTYVTQVSESDYKGFVNEFRKTGELTKLNTKGTKRIRLTGKDLTEAFKKCRGIDFYQSYNQLSKMVHPTIHHLHATIRPTTESEYDFCAGVTIGEKTKYPTRLYDELKEIIVLCVKHIALIWESL